MITIYNIRGTNGSGKSTLARSFIAGNPSALPNLPGVEGSPTMVDLAWYSSPTKGDPGRRRAVEGYASPHFLPGVDVLVVGPYRTTRRGLDAVPDFATMFKALERAVNVCAEYGRAEHQAIVCEGVLASTVWGSWGQFASDLIGHHPAGVQFAFAYLGTPLPVCLERIRGRQEAAGKVRDIKEDLVRNKIRAIGATRDKAIAAGHLVYDLPWEEPREALRQIMVDADAYDQPGRAREVYRAL